MYIQERILAMGVSMCEMCDWKRECTGVGSLDRYLVIVSSGRGRKGHKYTFLCPLSFHLNPGLTIRESFDESWLTTLTSILCLTTV